MGLLYFCVFDNALFILIHDRRREKWIVKKKFGSMQETTVVITK